MSRKVRQLPEVLNRTGILQLVCRRPRRAVECFRQCQEMTRDPRQRALFAFNRFQACVQAGSFVEALKAYKARLRYC